MKALDEAEAVLWAGLRHRDLAHRIKAAALFLRGYTVWSMTKTIPVVERPEGHARPRARATAT